MKPNTETTSLAQARVNIQGRSAPANPHILSGRKLMSKDKKWSGLFITNPEKEMHIFMSLKRQAEVYEFIFYVVQQRFPNGWISGLG